MSSSSSSHGPKRNGHKKKGARKAPYNRQHSSVINWAGTSTPPRMIVGDNNRITSFIQEIPDTVFSQTATTPAFFAQNYQFGFLDQSGSIAALYDQYRIAMVEVTFRPMFNANPLSALSSTIVPLLYTAIDYDDAVTPTSIGVMRAYANCMESQYETQVRRFVPHIAVAAYNGSFGGFSNSAAPWIDAASTSVQHYGLKVAIDPGATGQTMLQSWTVTTRYLLQCRNLR